MKLVAVVYSHPEAVRFTGEPLRASLELPESIPASRDLVDDEIGTSFHSTYLRSGDVPIAFLRESPSASAAVSAGNLGTHFELTQKLEALGRRLQYRFSDGLILYGHQVLYHAHSKLVPRHLLPLNVNITTEARDRLRPLRASGWQTEAEQVTLSVLLAAARAIRMAARNSEVEAPELYFAHDDGLKTERPAIRISTVELDSGDWGPWRLSTELHEPHSHVHHGRARLELDPAELGELEGLSKSFFLSRRDRRLLFHGFEEQLQRIKTRLGPGVTESGLSLHLSGHALIQTAIQEIAELRGLESKPLAIFPGAHHVAAAGVKPRVRITGDGAFRVFSSFQTLESDWEAHGIPQSLSYLVLGLQQGLGATTGFANSQLAQTRRGPRRERDLKILRHIGYAALIFYDAASFALGLPLSDGTLAKSEEAVAASLYDRLGGLVLKSEGWPIQSGSLVELCSKNVTTLIEGFIRQVVTDVAGRDVAIYLPQGEVKLEKLTRPYLLLFHAMVSDLALATEGACFSKARLKSFENFLNGRPNLEREDLAVRGAVDAETSARMVYQPGIGERYHLPDSIMASRATQVIGLLNHGFSLSIDGKEVEEFEGDDFRPEFTLREGPIEAVATGGHKIDWFELNPKFFFRGVEISGEQASRLSREGMLEFQGKLYRIKEQDLPSLKRLTRFWAGIQGHAAGLMKSPTRRRTEDTYYQLPRSQTLELLALRASGVKVRGGPRWDEICRFYDSLDQTRETLEMPETFLTKLQPYQVSGVQWILDLHALGLGGILADDMGLGKTVTSLAFLELLRAKDQMGPCLILVPTSLTYNWLAEAQRFTPEIPVHIFSGRDPEKMLDVARGERHSAIVCTYGLVQEHIEIFQQVKWSCLILDEAQNLKNITTKRTTAARKIEAAFKLCLTGTPLENHYGELYSLFDLIVPGSLGEIAAFRERYVNPARVLRDDIDDLKLKTKPLIMRRTKAQVMHELPPKLETTVKLPFEDEQRKIYRDIASSYNEQVRQAISRQGEAKSQLQMLTALLRLRQVCSDPSSIPGIEYGGEPPKITTLIEALEELTASGASALIFTQFLATFERIRKALAIKKIRCYDINGSDSRLNREKKIRGFQEDADGAVMLMTLKTGGVGLNLVKATYIFHIEPWWNPAVENQATDRAHRIGQTKTVQVYRYLIKDSVEEKIEVLKDIKSKRFDALFSVSENESEIGSGSSALTQKDFEFLLS